MGLPACHKAPVGSSEVGRNFPHQIMGWEMGIESALKRKRKDLQGTHGNVSTWKAVEVHVN